MKRCSSNNKLDPVLQNGLMHVGGRLHHAPVKDDGKHPIILPKKHHVVNLIINYYHKASGHSGVEYTISNQAKLLDNQSKIKCTQHS